MDGIASVAGVGAVVNQARIQAGNRPIVRLAEPEVSADMGSNALKLIQALVLDVLATGHDLDVKG